MVRREVLDDFLRQRAKTNGATLINGLFLGMTLPEKKGDSYVLTYNDYAGEEGNARKGEKKTLEVDVVIGADGANSRVAKDIEAGDYEYAIAFQERMTIPDNKMEYYKDRAEMYVGEDVSPDFYAWVFPKCDHVAVGTGTVVDKKGIQRYQQGIRDRAAPRIEGGKIIRVEAHPIPEHPRPWRVKDRAILVGDAAGYVTKCSGEGIYFAAKSGRMCAETIVKNSMQGVRMIDEADLMEHLREWDSRYGPTYLVLDLLQKVFYTSDAARESFVELCEEEYVQKVTFDSYLYKTVQGNDPVGDLNYWWHLAGGSPYRVAAERLLLRPTPAIFRLPLFVLDSHEEEGHRSTFLSEEMTTATSRPSAKTDATGMQFWDPPPEAPLGFFSVDLTDLCQGLHAADRANAKDLRPESLYETGPRNWGKA
eukprot:g20143.t1